MGKYDPDDPSLYRVDESTPSAAGGGKYAPSSAPVEVAAPQPPAKTWGETALDVARAVPAGVYQSGLNLLGMPRAIADVGFRKMAERAEPQTLSTLITPEERERRIQERLAQLRDNPVYRMSPSAPAIASIFGESYQPQTLPGEYTKTVAEHVPLALGNPVTGGGRAIVSNLVRYGVIPGLASETLGQVYKGTPEEGIARAAGSVLSPVAAGAVRRMITPRAPGPIRAAEANYLEGEGIPTTAGQRTGNRNLQLAEAEAGSRTQDLMQRQGEAFTEAAFRRAGEQGVTDAQAGWAAARTRLGNEYDQIATRNTLIPDPQMHRDVTDALNNYYRLVPPNSRAPIVTDVARDILNYGHNPVAGDQFQTLTSIIRRSAEGTSAPEVERALREMERSLTGGMERSMRLQGSPDAGRWADIDRQYANLIALRRPSAMATEGRLSPQAVHQAVNSGPQNQSAALMGRRDLQDLAQSGKDVLKPLPETGIRAMTQAAYAAPGAVVGGAGGYEHSGGWGAGIGAMLGGAASRAVGGRVLMSTPVQRFMSNPMPAGLAERGLRGAAAGAGADPFGFVQQRGGAADAITRQILEQAGIPMGAP